MKLNETSIYHSIRQSVDTQIAADASRHLILHRDGDLVQRHLSVGSTFCRAVVATGYLTQQQMNRAARRYQLGMSRDGGVIFWQIGPTSQVFDGKIMYYRPDCHRDHHRLPTWVSAVLKSFYLANEPELAAMLTTSHCLFGTHLLGYTAAAVAVVESEKTAVVLSEVYPQYLWLAAGGMSELSPSKLFPLRGRQITLFPDTDEDGQAYATWYKLCKESERLLGQSIHLSSLLELSATADQKHRKIDILDYYFETVKPQQEACLGTKSTILSSANPYSYEPKVI